MEKWGSSWQTSSGSRQIGVLRVRFSAVPKYLQSRTFHIYKKIRPVISTGLIYILTKTKLTTKKTNLLYCCLRNISWYLALMLSTICFQAQK